MNYLLFLLLLLTGLQASAQKKKAPPMPEMPDVNKLMKMTPAEREAYQQQMIKQTSQQVADYADATGLAVNKTLIPGFNPKPPKMEVEKLRLLPSQPPTRTQLVSSLQQSIGQIQKGIPAPKIEEIKKFTANQPVEAIHTKAIADFYSDDPKGAMLMMMEVAAKQPDSLLILNNLGAMFNLHGVEHKAVELFQYCLQKEPRSALVLNNIGQSFLGLGDLTKAAAYFRQCLSIDSLNIEANHSMGMVHYFQKEYDAAMRCFERELSIAFRRSTLAMAYKMGKKFNLRELAARRKKWSGNKDKDAFEEITLGKFSFPQLPISTREIIDRKEEFTTYGSSVMAEMQFWFQEQIKAGQIKEDPNSNYAGIYADLVEAMLEELHKEFTPEYLSGFSESEHETFQESINLLFRQLGAVQCPPGPAGSGTAHLVKCCEERKRPLADKLVAEWSSFFQPRWDRGQQRWKSYINQLVAIVQLEPSPGNQAMVYAAVSQYFNFLTLGAGQYSAGDVVNMIPDCKQNYNKEQIDSLIASARDWKLECPSWLNMEVDFGGMVVKADCNKYAIEVGGGGVMGAFEHEFKSGNSTLLFGPAQKLEFIGLTAELKSQMYITFDKNKSFADFGVKNTGELGIVGTPIPFGPRIKVGGNLAGIEVSNTMGLSSGYNESFEKKGLINVLFP